MLSERCLLVFGRGVGLGLEDMSALSVRAPGLQTTLIDSRAIRVRGMTTIDSVKRNLFGCSDREENRRFVERELSRQLDLDSQRWGFDFANDKPLPGNQRYSWDLVPASTVPSALRRASATIPPTNNTSTQEPKVQTMVSSPESSKTQKRITDFLKPRKRLSAASKKSPAHKRECGNGAHIRPPKVARLTPSHFKRPS